MGFRFDRLSTLVIEDTMPMRKLIGSVLDTLGVGTVYFASNGEQGFHTFQENNPDIVLCDWHMEPMSGIEFVMEVRRNPLSRNRMVPIILITGYNAVPRVRQARDSGVTEYLVKPFSAADLSKRIAHVINKPRDFIDNLPEFFGPDRRRTQASSYRGPYRRKSDRYT